MTQFDWNNFTYTGHSVVTCQIAGEKAWLRIYRKYETRKGPHGPVAYPWSITITGETLAEGEAEGEFDAGRQMWEAVKRLRKERRKQR